MAVAKAAGLGLGAAKSAISNVAAGVKTAAASHAGSGIISRAVGTAAIGGGIGAGVNAVRGDDVWEGAKRGAVMGGMASLGKSAYKGDMGRAWRHGTGQSNSDLRGMLTRGPSADAPFLSNSLSNVAGAKANAASGAKQLALPAPKGVSAAASIGETGGTGSVLPSAPSGFNSKLVRSMNKGELSNFSQSTGFLDNLSGGSVKFGRNAEAIQARGTAPRRPGPSAGIPAPSWSQFAPNTRGPKAKDVRTLEKFGRNLSLSNKVAGRQ